MTSRSSFGSRGSSRTLSSSSRRVSSASSRSISSRAIARSSSSDSEEPRSSRAPASSWRVASRRRKASTAGSRRASSWPSRRSSDGLVEVSGSDSSAWRSSYWRATSASLASRSLTTRWAGRSSVGRMPASTSTRWSRPRPGAGQVEDERLAREVARTGRDGLAVGFERLLHRDDRDLDHVVRGLLGRDHLHEQTRVEQHLDQRVRAVPRPEPEDLVADRGDDRDQQHAAADHDQRLLPADQGERDDREQDHDDQEFRAAALVRGWVLADLADGQRIAGLEGVDRHVLRAVVLEHPRDVRRATDQRRDSRGRCRPAPAPRRGAGSGRSPRSRSSRTRRAAAAGRRSRCRPPASAGASG